MPALGGASGTLQTLRLRTAGKPGGYTLSVVGILPGSNSLSGTETLILEVCISTAAARRTPRSTPLAPPQHPGPLQRLTKPSTLWRPPMLWISKPGNPAGPLKTSSGRGTPEFRRVRLPDPYQVAPGDPVIVGAARVGETLAVRPAPLRTRTVCRAPSPVSGYGVDGKDRDRDDRRDLGHLHARRRRQGQEGQGAGSLHRQRGDRGRAAPSSRCRICRAEHAP